MTRTLTTLAILLATTITALADGKTDTLAVVNVTIAKSECGLEPQDWARTSAANSLQFTGLSQKDWVDAVADMATIRAEQMYADRSIGRFWWLGRGLGFGGGSSHQPHTKTHACV